MRLDASALRALNLTEAPGNIVRLNHAALACSLTDGICTGLEQEYDSLWAAEQVQDRSGFAVAWKLAQATASQQA